jgi:hypothetical protein
MEPINYSYSKDQMIAEAKKFLIDLYGLPVKSENKDKWMERFGLLVSFISERFPE